LYKKRQGGGTEICANPGEMEDLGQANTIAVLEVVITPREIPHKTKGCLQHCALFAARYAW